MRRAVLILLAVTLLLAAGCDQPGSTATPESRPSPNIPAGDGILLGGIEYTCAPPGTPATHAGNVVVLPGRLAEIGPWIAESRVAGIQAVTSQVVSEGRHFRFVLPAGWYALIDDDGGQRSVTSGGVTVFYMPWTNARVEAGQTSWWEIPGDPTGCPVPIGRSWNPTPIDAYPPTT